MLRRSLNLFILIYFSLVFTCFSQNKRDSIQKNNVVNQFNNYLKAVKLNTLIKATGFSFKKEIVQKGSLGEITITHVRVLTLEPAQAYTDPLAFSAAWANLVNTVSRKTDIYSQLFFILYDYSQSSPDSLAIVLKTTHPDFVSFTVFFNKSIKVNTAFIEIRGEPAAPVNVDPGDLNNGLIGGIEHNVPNSPALRKRLEDGMISF